jgi:hypothetical protein
LIDARRHSIETERAALSSRVEVALAVKRHRRLGARCAVLSTAHDARHFGADAHFDEDI